MVESTQHAAESDIDDDFDLMKNMNTMEQQDRNRQTFYKLEKRFITTEDLEDCSFEGDKEFYFPSLFAQDTRSYITKSSFNDDVPIYDAKIYEFNYYNKGGIQEFLNKNPNI